MSQTAKVPAFVLVFRMTALAISLFYLFDSLSLHAAMTGPGEFGGMWRFLTIWTFTVNVLIAISMAIQCLQPGRHNWHSLLSVGMGLNFYVLLAYWGLYFLDKSLVQGDASLPLYRQSYLHVGMILLCWIEGFVFHRIWVKTGRVIALFFAFFLGYMAWLELVLMPINGAFPYPFLNDMSFVQRMMFHGGSMLVSALFMGLAYVVSRWTNGFAPGWPKTD